MHLKMTITLGLMFMMQSVMAALPPTAESMRRIKTIMESKEVYDALGGAEWVKTITETDHGYVLETQKCKLYVKVNAIDKPASSPKLIGPSPLEVSIQKKECH
ncbi:hypothetical protein [Candidatus Berkiella aquae]|uniref:PepSY domain-containing protein n=1 Tax=Candidatus Berkiella aquae TaxID=295108 RepID=A0A0Q9YMY6_9GAMM|nr:hypothetical protein [Candidatus Berkiella aquae]MCS5712657.1 hypothetical protein [Candidatus Berkiella aquae]